MLTQGVCVCVGWGRDAPGQWHPCFGETEALLTNKARGVCRWMGVGGRAACRDPRLRLRSRPPHAAPSTLSQSSSVPPCVRTARLCPKCWVGLAGVVSPDFGSSREDEGCLEEAVASVH